VVARGRICEQTGKGRWEVLASPRRCGVRCQKGLGGLAEWSVQARRPRDEWTAEGRSLAWAIGSVAQLRRTLDRVAEFEAGARAGLRGVGARAAGD